MSEINQTPGQPDPVFVIKDLQTLRVLTDAFRLQIVSILNEPSSVKQLANRLNIQPVRLYYHINMLEQHGLIRVIGSRVVSGILEKFYQATAVRYQPDPELLSFAPGSDASNMDFYLSSLLDATKRDIKRSFQANQIEMAGEEPRIRRLATMQMVVRLTPSQAVEAYNRFSETIKVLEQMDRESATDEEARLYELMMVLFPTLIDDSNGEDSDSDK